MDENYKTIQDLISGIEESIDKKNNMEAELSTLSNSNFSNLSIDEQVTNKKRIEELKETIEYYNNSFPINIAQAYSQLKYEENNLQTNLNESLKKLENRRNDLEKKLQAHSQRINSFSAKKPEFDISKYNKFSDQIVAEIKNIDGAIDYTQNSYKTKFDKLESFENRLDSICFLLNIDKDSILNKSQESSIESTVESVEPVQSSEEAGEPPENKGNDSSFESKCNQYLDLRSKLEKDLKDFARSYQFNYPFDIKFEYHPELKPLVEKLIGNLNKDIPFEDLADLYDWYPAKDYITDTTPLDDYISDINLILETLNEVEQNLQNNVEPEEPVQSFEETGVESPVEPEEISVEPDEPVQSFEESGDLPKTDGDNSSYEAKLELYRDLHSQVKNRVERFADSHYRGQVYGIIFTEHPELQPFNKISFKANNENLTFITDLYNWIPNNVNDSMSIDDYISDMKSILSTFEEVEQNLQNKVEPYEQPVQLFEGTGVESTVEPEEISVEPVEPVQSSEEAGDLPKTDGDNSSYEANFKQYQDLRSQVRNKVDHIAEYYYSCPAYEVKYDDHPELHLLEEIASKTHSNNVCTDLMDLYCWYPPIVDAKDFDNYIVSMESMLKTLNQVEQDLQNKVNPDEPVRSSKQPKAKEFEPGDGGDKKNKTVKWDPDMECTITYNGEQYDLRKILAFLRDEENEFFVNEEKTYFKTDKGFATLNKYKKMTSNYSPNSTIETIYLNKISASIDRQLSHPFSRNLDRNLSELRNLIKISTYDKYAPPMKKQIDSIIQVIQRNFEFVENNTDFKELQQSEPYKKFKKDFENTLARLEAPKEIDKLAKIANKMRKFELRGINDHKVTEYYEQYTEYIQQCKNKYAEVSPTITSLCDSIEDHMSALENIDESKLASQKKESKLAAIKNWFKNLRKPKKALTSGDSPVEETNSENPTNPAENPTNPADASANKELDDFISSLKDGADAAREESNKPHSQNSDANTAETILGEVGENNGGTAK